VIVMLTMISAAGCLRRRNLPPHDANKDQKRKRRRMTAVALGVGVLPGAMGCAGNAWLRLVLFVVVYLIASSGKGRGGH
jgi:hypothetical protein